MQFLIIARDYPDAYSKRMTVRPKHLAECDKLIEQGKLVYGIGLLNDQQQLAGSVMLFNVSSREELDAILKTEIYITSKVWEKVEILSAKLGPAFEKLHTRM